ncbi:hypothetical protein OAW32_01555, partial [bacterium]|nr:hypothetical protein [bacterium]
RIPTTDLYFANAFKPWAAKYKTFRSEGPNSFSNEQAIVICREEKKIITRRLLNQNKKRIYYVIDDNLWDIENINSIPFDYKKKLISLREGQHKEIINRSTVIIVSSEFLQNKYRERGYNTFLINPYWSEKIPNSWTFSGLNKNSPLRIGYLGTASHVDDRNFTMQVYQGLLENDANVELTIIGYDGVAKNIRAEPKLKIEKYKNWALYRKHMQNQKFDVLLYPSLPSNFNNARSMNKLIEHAVYGALGVYSESWPYAEMVSSKRIGITLKNNADLWIDRLTLLSRERNFQDFVGDPSDITNINEAARLSQIDYWSTAFDIK